MDSIKKRLLSGRLSFGTWLSICNSAVIEAICQSGFEWVVVDMEHSPFGVGEAHGAIRIIDLCGRIPIVRVNENNPTVIKSVLDAGAHAIIVPMVNTKEQAQRALDASKYPPYGTRGVGLSRAQQYGFGFDEYKTWSEREVTVVLQIEHIDAINNLEEIFQLKGIDATLIGPYDLSGSLGHPGDFEFPEFRRALEKYERLSKSYKIPMGYHIVEPDAKTVRDKIERGYKFLAVGLDTIFLGRACRDTVKNIKNMQIEQ